MTDLPQNRFFDIEAVRQHTRTARKRLATARRVRDVSDIVRDGLEADGMFVLSLPGCGVDLIVEHHQEFPDHHIVLKIGDRDE